MFLPVSRPIVEIHLVSPSDQIPSAKKSFRRWSLMWWSLPAARSPVSMSKARAAALLISHMVSPSAQTLKEGGRRTSVRGTSLDSSRSTMESWNTV